jgi:hypothetical protein
MPLICQAPLHRESLPRSLSTSLLTGPAPKPPPGGLLVISYLQVSSISLPCAPCPVPCALCPVPCALCPVPCAPCPVPCALCPVPRAPCPVPCAPCPVPRALCPVPCAPCPVPCAPCPTPYTLSLTWYLFLSEELRFISSPRNPVRKRNDPMIITVRAIKK